MRSLFLTRPDDWHLHLRDGDLLAAVAPETAKHFARALLMPNLLPPLTSVDAVMAYRQSVLDCTAGTSFTPYMTLFINESLSLETLYLSQKNPYILGAKLYPAGATTNSSQGVHAIQTLYPLFAAMQELDLVLQLHGESVQHDIFDREALFIEEVLLPLTQNFPKLRIVLEHISTAAAVEFVEQASERVCATITPHHLFYNRNHLLSGGIRPHYYCLPILKHEKHQRAVQRAAMSGQRKFFAGTDSAPHLQSQKESACGCAGIYSAPYAVAMYAEIFDACGKLQQLEAFMSQNGAEFYQLSKNQTQIELIQQPQQIPQVLNFECGPIVPIGAGNTLQWSVKIDA